MQDRHSCLSARQLRSAAARRWSRHSCLPVIWRATRDVILHAQIGMSAPPSNAPSGRVVAAAAAARVAEALQKTHAPCRQAAARLARTFALQFDAMLGIWRASVPASRASGRVATAERVAGASRKTTRIHVAKLPRGALGERALPALRANYKLPKIMDNLIFSRKTLF